MNKKCNCCGKVFVAKEPWYLLCADCWSEEQYYIESMEEYEHDDWGDRD